MKSKSSIITGTISTDPIFTVVLEDGNHKRWREGGRGENKHTAPYSHAMIAFTAFAGSTPVSL